MIKNYGIYWEREEIQWGSPGRGNAGKLLGYRGAKSKQVDFRTQVGIYVLYDGADIVSQEIVYVGQAGNGNSDLYQRLYQHTSDRLWNRWNRFSWFGLRAASGTGLKPANSSKLTPNDAMNELEALLIELMEPRLNRRGGNWKGAVEYYQVHDDEEEEYDAEEDMAEVKQRLESIEARLKDQE